MGQNQNAKIGLEKSQKIATWFHFLLRFKRFQVWIQTVEVPNFRTFPYLTKSFFSKKFPRDAMTDLWKSLNVQHCFSARFHNDACRGTGSKNGTCYTASECQTKGGTNGGTCASGYGVCCLCKTKRGLNLLHITIMVFIDLNYYSNSSFLAFL